jgi:hypothetical protein
MAPASRAQHLRAILPGFGSKLTGVKWVYLICHTLLMYGALDCRGEGCLHDTHNHNILSQVATIALEP